MFDMFELWLANFIIVVLMKENVNFKVLSFNFTIWKVRGRNQCHVPRNFDTKQSACTNINFAVCLILMQISKFKILKQHLLNFYQENIAYEPCKKTFICQ